MLWTRQPTHIRGDIMIFKRIGLTGLGAGLGAGPKAGHQFAHRRQGPYLFVINTDASTSGIRDSLANDLRLREVAHQGYVTLGGRGETFIYEASDIVMAEAFRISGMALVGLQDYPMKFAAGHLAAEFLTGVPSQLNFENALTTSSAANSSLRIERMVSFWPYSFWIASGTSGAKPRASVTKAGNLAGWAVAKAICG